jgi:hypothetical protein
MRHWLIALMLLTLTSACAPGATPPFADSFDDARNNWTLTRSNQADLSIEGGQLRITVKQPDSLAWSIAVGKTFDDFTIEVDATPLSGPEDNDYGVIVRHVNDENFYRFEISGDGYFNVQKRVKGQWEKLITDWTPSEAIHKGYAANHLRVVCAGSSLTFYVNQAQLIQVNDNSFARGQVGLFVGTLAQPGVQAAFDNLNVSK